MLIESDVITRDAIMPRSMIGIRFTLLWNELFLTQSIEGWVVWLGEGDVSSAAFGGRSWPVEDWLNLQDLTVCDLHAWILLARLTGCDTGRFIVFAEGYFLGFNGWMRTLIDQVLLKSGLLCIYISHRQRNHEILLNRRSFSHHWI